MPTRDPQFQSRDFIHRVLVSSGLALLTLALYWPVLHHDFIEYDDQQYVTDNPRVQAGLTWAGLVWAFGFHAGNWHPLAWLSHMLDCQLFGAQAGGHHLTSVLWHIGSTLLLFAWLNRMTGFLWRSAAVAAIFAWHPLHVESVAWVAERKDVLCAFFWMLTLWTYARYVELFKNQNPRAKVFYSLTLVAFAFCLLAKPMSVTLPFVLLLLDYWPLQRVTKIKRLVGEKIPFFMLAAIGCWLTLAAQSLAIVSTAGLPISERVLHALIAYAHYFAATFLPYHLAIYYPYETNLPKVFFGLALITLGLVTLFALKNIRHRPYLIVGWLWFLGTLVPVIGLVQVGDQAWADRYAYLPLVGLAIAAVWGVAEIIKNRLALQTIAAAATIAMLALTTVQLRYWQNTRTLFTHANDVTKNNFLAVTILGSVLAKEGRLESAKELYARALQIKPTFPEAHFFMGDALDEQGRLDEAIAEYRQALWFRPTQEQAHIFIGIALGKQKHYEEALEHYAAALKLNPDSAVTHNNIGRIRHTQGKFDEAVAQYRAALELDPKLALAHNNLGILLLQKGSLADGTKQLRAALQLNPTNSETQFNLALALNQQQQWNEAADLFAKIVNPGSSDPNAHYEFATALAHAKKTHEAMSEYAAALLIQPDFPAALDGLAWILSTDPNPEIRNGTEAVKMSERACALTEDKDVKKLKTLAAAYAEVGRFEDAARTINTALGASGAGSNAAELQVMLKQFQDTQPWRTTNN